MEGVQYKCMKLVILFYYIGVHAHHHRARKISEAGLTMVLTGCGGCGGRHVWLVVDDFGSDANGIRFTSFF